MREFLKSIFMLFGGIRKVIEVCDWYGIIFFMIVVFYGYFVIVKFLLRYGVLRKVWDF